MKKALINNNEEGRICDVVLNGQQFEVHKDFLWVDCDDAVDTSWTWDLDDNGKVIFTKPNIMADPAFIETGVLLARTKMYGSIGDQLDMLYRELKANGSISTNGEWFKHIDNVKTTLKSGDLQAVMSTFPKQ